MWLAIFEPSLNVQQRQTLSLNELALCFWTCRLSKNEPPQPMGCPVDRSLRVLFVLVRLWKG